MMWQEIIVAICVFAAFAFLAKRYLPFFKKNSAGCDTGCGSCSGPTQCHSPSDKT